MHDAVCCRHTICYFAFFPLSFLLLCSLKLSPILLLFFVTFSFCFAATNFSCLERNHYRLSIFFQLTCLCMNSYSAPCVCVFFFFWLRFFPRHCLSNDFFSLFGLCMSKYSASFANKLAFFVSLRFFRVACFSSPL